MLAIILWSVSLNTKRMNMYYNIYILEFLPGFVREIKRILHSAHIMPTYPISGMQTIPVPVEFDELLRLLASLFVNADYPYQLLTRSVTFQMCLISFWPRCNESIFSPS